MPNLDFEPITHPVLLIALANIAAIKRKTEQGTWAKNALDQLIASDRTNKRARAQGPVAVRRCTWTLADGVSPVGRVGSAGRSGRKLSFRAEMLRSEPRRTDLPHWAVALRSQPAYSDAV